MKWPDAAGVDLLIQQVLHNGPRWARICRCLLGLYSAVARRRAPYHRPTISPTPRLFHLFRLPCPPAMELTRRHLHLRLVLLRPSGARRCLWSHPPLLRSATFVVIFLVTLSAKLTVAVYCYQSCLWACLQRVDGWCVFVYLWVCYHDNSKLRASILTKLGL